VSGFSNAVVGGIGKLVRKWIQSPDYVAGTTGWTVNQDGSAEFNDITIRGVIVVTGSAGEVFAYKGTPALGNLILAIAGSPGTDPYGNAFDQGLTIPASSVGGNLGEIRFGDTAVDRGALIYATSSAGVNNVVNIEGPYDLAAGGAAIIRLMYIPGTQERRMSMGADNVFITGNNEISLQPISIPPPVGSGLAISSGLSGWYHYEEWDIDTAGTYTIANATVSVINGSRVTISKSHTDYGNGYDPAAGTFTPPVKAIYHLTLTVGFVTFAASSRMFVGIRKNGAYVGIVDAVNNSASHAAETVSAELELSTIDVVDFVVFQASGAIRTIENSGIIRSFLSIRRVL
jgi:hypothetical protein